jgi:hypothetical protein
MHVIRGHNTDKIHSLLRWQFRFLLNHLGIITITAFRRKVEVIPADPGYLLVTAKGSTDQLDLAIQAAAMRCTAPIKAPRHPLSFPS